MNEEVTTEEKRSDSITQLWNDRLQLTSQLDKLIEPFRRKYRLRPDQIEISFTHVGAFIKVTL